MTSLNERAATLVYGPAPALPQGVRIALALKAVKGHAWALDHVTNPLLGGEVFLGPEPLRWLRNDPDWAEGIMGIFDLRCPWPGATLCANDMSYLEPESTPDGTVLRLPRSHVAMDHAAWYAAGCPEVDLSEVRWVPPDYARCVVARISLLSAVRSRFPPNVVRRVAAHFTSPLDLLDSAAVLAILQEMEST